MIGAVQRALSRFRGTGSAAITLPPMDGALRPNEAIEHAALRLAVDKPDNLVCVAGEVWFSRGAQILRLAGKDWASPELVTTMDAPVSCMAADADDNVVAGLDDGRIVFAWGARRGLTLTAPTVGSNCPTALLIEGQTLHVCHGSARNPPSQWKRDLMQREASGSVWCTDLGTLRSTCIAAGLAFPCGIARTASADLVVSEGFRHRLVRIAPPGQSLASSATPVLDALPGYPGRLSPADGGGHWLCVFAPRSRLVEFVLGERGYCLDMIRELEPEHWIAPALNSGSSFLEPLQGGAVKQMGILKPWAPSRSYGLLVRLDEQCQPVASFHSRADGRRHGITSCVQIGTRVLVASQGGDALLELAA